MIRPSLAANSSLLGSISTTPSVKTMVGTTAPALVQPLDLGHRRRVLLDIHPDVLDAVFARNCLERRQSGHQVVP